MTKQTELNPLDLTLEDLIIVESDSASGTKDVDVFAECIRKTFDKLILVNFTDNDKFTALTGIKGIYSYQVAGLEGKIGAPSLAQLAINFGGLFVPKAIYSKWIASKCKTVYFRMLKHYNNATAQADTQAEDGEEK